jgi:hypothetical protein
MSKFYVAGPAYCFTGTGAGSSYEFFGFTERGLTLSVSGQYEDVGVDYSGLMPGDVSMLGQEATLSGTFTRYNESVLIRLMSFINGVAAGFGPSFSVGTLLQSEQVVAGLVAAPPLIIYCPYGSKTEFSDMIKTFHFYNVYISDRMSQALSVRRKAPEITWRAIPAFGTVSGNQFLPNTPPYDSYQLYAINDVSNINGLLSLVD